MADRPESDLDLALEDWQTLLAATEAEAQAMLAQREAQATMLPDELIPEPAGALEAIPDVEPIEPGEPELDGP